MDARSIPNPGLAIGARILRLFHPGFNCARMRSSTGRYFASCARLRIWLRSAFTS